MTAAIMALYDTLRLRFLVFREGEGEGEGKGEGTGVRRGDVCESVECSMALRSPKKISGTYAALMLLCHSTVRR